MKISDKIKAIVKRAEEVYGVPDHLNGGIDVCIYVSDDGWQICLSRASRNALDSGECYDNTRKKVECLVACQSYDHPTLAAALNHLADQLEDPPLENEMTESFYF